MNSDGCRMCLTTPSNRFSKAVVFGKLSSLSFTTYSCGTFLSPASKCQVILGLFSNSKAGANEVISTPRFCCTDLVTLDDILDHISPGSYILVFNISTSVVHFFVKVQNCWSGKGVRLLLMYLVC